MDRNNTSCPQDPHMHRGLTLRLPKHDAAAIAMRNRLTNNEDAGIAGDGQYSYPTEQDELGSNATSRPVVLLDVIRLAGYLPTEIDQAQAMVKSLRTAIFDDSGLYHERKLMDLFLSNKAKHGISSGHAIQKEYLEMPYPDILRDGVTTKDVWEKLNDPHEIPVVQRVFGHLITCQQPLLWKFDMRCEILRIVEEEMVFRELENWKKRRSAELEQLYMVRETIEHRVKMAEEAEARHLAERDNVVAERMKHRAGLTSFDLHSTVFCFPEDDHEIMGFSTATSTYDEGFFEKKEGTDGESSWTQSHGDDKIELEERRHTEILRDATIVENSVLEECTTSALRVAMAKVTALNKKLAEVDELLESLQDEEWAEADGEGESTGNQLTYPHPRESVLTPILAMVLGANDMQHASLAKEHHEIVQAWRDFFGRLPPLPIDKSKNKVEPEDFGIVDNEGDWEDLADSVSEDDEISQTD